MNEKISKVIENSGIMLYGVSLILLYYTYKYQYEFTPCCDVNGYQSIAKNYLEKGLFSNHELASIRTYGFPLILSIFYFLFGDEYAKISYAIFVSGAYIILSVLISIKLKLYVKNRNVINAAFAMNIFLFPYLTIPIADGISVVVWLLIFFIILELIENPNKNKIYMLAFFCSMLSGFSIMIRPSNINLILLVPLILGLVCFIKPKTNKIIMSMILVVGLLVTIIPQVYINYKLFHKISFLPTTELGDLQIRWGIEYVKYATNLSGIGVPQLYYKNPFFLKSDNLSLTWYLQNPGLGVKTALLHIFNAFTYDYYFPYIYNLYPRYKNILQLYSWLVLFYGVMGISNLLQITYNNTSNQKSIKYLVFIILPLITLPYLGILSVSAVESRFSLPLVVVLIPLAYWSFFENIRNLKIWLAFILWISCAFLVSAFVELQKNIPYM